MRRVKKGIDTDCVGKWIVFLGINIFFASVIFKDAFRLYNLIIDSKIDLSLISIDYYIGNGGNLFVLLVPFVIIISAVMTCALLYNPNLMKPGIGQTVYKILSIFFISFAVVGFAVVINCSTLDPYLRASMGVQESYKTACLPFDMLVMALFIIYLPEELPEKVGKVYSIGIILLLVVFLILIIIKMWRALLVSALYMIVNVLLMLGLSLYIPFEFSWFVCFGITIVVTGILYKYIDQIYYDVNGGYDYERFDLSGVIDYKIKPVNIGITIAFVILIIIGIPSFFELTNIILGNELADNYYGFDQFLELGSKSAGDAVAIRNFLLLTVFISVMFTEGVEKLFENVLTGIERLLFGFVLQIYLMPTIAKMIQFKMSGKSLADIDGFSSVGSGSDSIGAKVIQRYLSFIYGISGENTALFIVLFIIITLAIIAGLLFVLMLMLGGREGLADIFTSSINLEDIVLALVKIVFYPVYSIILTCFSLMMSFLFPNINMFVTAIISLLLYRFVMSFFDTTIEIIVS